MRRYHPPTFLRLLVAGIVALASFGPRVTYAHAHPVASDAHHDHTGHDAPDHDDHDRPGLSEGNAHVHGSWLGLAFTLPAMGGSGASASGLGDACPTFSADPGTGHFGPLKERVPWPSTFVPPEPFRLSVLAGHPSPNPLLLGAWTSHALSGRRAVLRC